MNLCPSTKERGRDVFESKMDKDEFEEILVLMKNKYYMSARETLSLTLLCRQYANVCNSCRNYDPEWLARRIKSAYQKNNMEELVKLCEMWDNLH